MQRGIVYAPSKSHIDQFFAQGGVKGVYLIPLAVARHETDDLHGL